MNCKVVNAFKYVSKSYRIISPVLLRKYKLETCRSLSSNIGAICNTVHPNNTAKELSVKNQQISKPSLDFSARVGDTKETRSEGLQGEEFIENSLVTEPCKEDLSSFAPYALPAFNFAAYANKSRTLQELVKLGVDLHTLEKKKGVPELILQLDFDRDIAKYIRFLHDFGVPSDELGTYFTKNPFILKEDLDNLVVRISYLQSKKFTDEMISRIITKNPYWLLYSTARIDKRLGYFQKEFKLKGDEVRSLTTKLPRLITYSLSHIKANSFSIKEEMGFTDDEMKQMLLTYPRLWMKSNKLVLATFDFVHNIMKLSHQQIQDFPNILTNRTFRIKQRHLFLESLGRAQYNPNLEGYVSLKNLVSGTDTEFCQSAARSSVEAFNIFLKSL